jgi:hypothetical protein
MCCMFISTSCDRAIFGGYCWQGLDQSLTVRPSAERDDGEVRDVCGTQTDNRGGEVVRDGNAPQ